VFTGNYVTGDVDAAYLNRLEELRNDDKRFKSAGATSGDNGIIDLYNDED
jgi:amidophosphoribosyltransferase